MPAARLVCTHAMTLPAPPAAVFPLLCPVREAEWLPGWTAGVLHSRSGFAEEGCVFSTPDDGGDPWIWQITAHDPDAGRVRFAITVPGSHVRLLDIALEGAGEGCRATWTYALTATSAAGDAALQAFKAGFPARMAHVEGLLSHFLATGRILEASPA